MIGNGTLSDRLLMNFGSDIMSEDGGHNGNKIDVRKASLRDRESAGKQRLPTARTAFEAVEQ